MLRHFPKFEYCGLTIVLSNPSRFDHTQLLSGNGGHFLCTDILYPLGITRYNCDIRLADSLKEPLLPNTKCVILLGSKSMTLGLPPEIVKDNKLDHLRGSCYSINDVVYLCSFSPQDAVDKQNWEFQLNPEMIDWLEFEVKKKQDSNPEGFKKRKGFIFRANYRFWLRKDIEKIVNILLNHQGKIPHHEPDTYIIYPNSNDCINYLNSLSNTQLYFDMETDMRTGKITCFAVGDTIGHTSPIFCIPTILQDYTFPYSEWALSSIMLALAKAIKRNTIVSHNGAAFDFFILAWKYKIPIYKAYDTMIAQHRCYPMIEKNLGVATSLWTYEPFHKDEVSFSFGNKEQFKAQLAYCGKDVGTMRRIHKSIAAYAKTQQGLEISIEQAMSSVRPYLITSLLGVGYVEDKVIDTMAENDRLCMCYLKLIEWFIGPTYWALLKKKSKKGMPGSNNQCVMYFHEMLGYKVVSRSKKTKKPSLAKKALFKLKLLYNNPVIDLCISYRRALKETGTLKFVPFNINNTQMINNL